MDNVKLVEIGVQVNCDFRCGYCISEKADNWTKLTSLDVDMLITYIQTHFNERVLIHLTGGEPLLWVGLEKLVLTLPNKIMISTNLKHIHSNPWIYNLYAELNHRLCFRIGFHPNVRTDDFISKINVIKNCDYHYVVNYMVDEIDRAGGYKDRIIFLKNNNINYEVSPEYVEGNALLYDYISSQFHMRTFIDNLYFVRINSNTNVYSCYSGNIIGDVKLNTLDKISNTMNYCNNCVGLKGYTKILSQWGNYNISELFPQKSRFKNVNQYYIFQDMVNYLKNIDDEDLIYKIKTPRKIHGEINE